jgi:HTH-type transcriptional regulator/antitoxin HigA
MEIQPIKNSRDHKSALKRIDALMDATPGSSEEDELDILATLVWAYEEKNHPIDPPDPISAIKFCMEQQGLTRADLEPYIGTRARVSEVLTGKRALSINMIRRLHNGLQIPLESLLKEA